MSKITFEEDPSSRKVIRFLFLLQIAGMGIVLGLSSLHLSLLALGVSVLTLLLSLTSLLGLYARYREVPTVREKRDLEHLVLKFQKGFQKEGELIRAAVKERELLTQAEKEEIHLTLRRLQEKHIERGLAVVSIQEAEIPGVDLKLKQQLAGYGILSAAEVTEGIARAQDVEEAQRLALLGWRTSLMNQLESTKPVGLTETQLDSIQEKYQVLHAKNDALHRKARTSKQLLEHETISFQARLRELASLTFVRYLSMSLASHGVVAALIALLLVVAQLFSSVSATRSVMMDSLPAATSSPVGTMPPTEMIPQVTSPALTDTPSSLITPATPSFTPSVMASPVVTQTTAQTLTPQAALPLSIAACIPQNTSRETGLVVGVVDGDTIDVR